MVVALLCRLCLDDVSLLVLLDNLSWEEVLRLVNGFPGKLLLVVSMVRIIVTLVVRMCWMLRR